MAKSVSEPLKSRKSSRSRPRGNLASREISEYSVKNNFFYQAHYVSGLIVLIGFLVFLSYRGPDNDQSSYLTYYIIYYLFSIFHHYSLTQRIYGCIHFIHFYRHVDVPILSIYPTSSIILAFYSGNFGSLFVDRYFFVVSSKFLKRAKIIIHLFEGY